MLINNDTIIKDDNPLIRQKSLPVSLPLSEEDSTILKEMLKYVEDSTDEEIAEIQKQAKKLVKKSKWLDFAFYTCAFLMIVVGICAVV